MGNNITVAKTAGFCFGVNRAVELVFSLLDEGEKVCTLGPIIHNDQMVNELKAKGVRIVETPEEANGNEVLVIRSHGVTSEIYERAKKLGVKISDATCPFVAKIHKIVAEAGLSGKTVLIAGDKNHKEVEGIVGHKSGKVIVFQTEDELKKLVEEGKISADEHVLLVAQTTFNKDLFKNIQKTLKKVCTNAKIFDTICNATANRQEEAKSLSALSDAMIVVGGRHSSNTAKLFEVCSGVCKNVVLVETADELNVNDFAKFQNVGIVAGASTPAGIIKEVQKTMSETENTANEAVEINDGMTFEEMLNASESGLNTDQHVKGYVLAVNPTEVQVDIGRKHTGYITAEEFSNDPGLKLEEAVKVGDVLDLIIMRTNDQEGTVQLSKRRYDAVAGWEKAEKACEDKEILEAPVTEVVNGGLICLWEGIRVFVPASHATLNRGESYEELKGQTVRFRIIEASNGTGRGRSRRKVIGSIRSVMREERKEAESKIWETISVGDRIKGKVKSLTGYGAFVDLGGVDGMVHISELSWQRIKHPSEIVSVGDEIEVYVKAVDKENRKISLGYKKADENPWEIFKNNYNVGDTVDAKIVGMTAYGAFARVIPGIDGLVHISQIANRRIEKPQDELKINEDVKAKITDIDFDKKRVSLSIRALLEPETEAEEATEETAE